MLPMGVTPGDWLMMVRGVFKDLESQLQIEPFVRDNKISGGVWYRYPNILQRLANAVDDAAQ